MASQVIRDTEQAFSIALARISDEAERQTGTLDLSGLVLITLPDSLFNLTHLRVLNLGYPEGISVHGGGIDSKYSELGRLTRLETLSVRGCGIGSLVPFQNLSLLEHLDCSNNSVSDLKPLAGCTALLTLDCSNTNVSDLVPLAGCTALRTLKCSNTRVSPQKTKVSDLKPLAGCTALRTLDCSNTQVSDLKPLAGCTALRTLDCSNTQVNDLEPLAGCTALRTLNCSNTQVSDLKPLAGCTALHTLDCSVTQVSDLEPLAGCTALHTLDCSVTQVSDLKSLAGCTALRTLECAGTVVSDLEPLAGCTALHTLDCSVTQVSYLEPLAGCTALRRLNCAESQVSDLEPLAGCKSLNFLNCSCCHLISIPPDILSLPELSHLELFEATVVGMPPAGVLPTYQGENCLERIRAYVADLAEGAEDLLSVKLLVLGNGGVGKTQIARWLAGESFDLDWNSTHGIKVSSAIVRGDPESRLYIWDFGGQDIYLGAHALFLTSPAILAVVWAEDTEGPETHRIGELEFRNQPLPYWIDVARHQGHAYSPLLILQSKCDRPEDEARRFPMPHTLLDALPYAKQLHVSAKTPRGFASLKETLSDAASWLRAPERLGLPRIGAGPLRVQRRLEALRDADQRLPPGERRHRLLTMAEFEAICAEEGGVSAPKHLLTYLDADGTILYRPGLFMNRIVLDQNWALEAVYSVFEHANDAFTEIGMANGRFTKAQLGRSVWKEHGQADQELFITLMRSCGICFRHRTFDNGILKIVEYIAPDLLPKRADVADRVVGAWDDDRDGEEAVFRYPLLHGGLIRTILTDLGELAGADALYWQGGVCGFETTRRSRFRVEQIMTGPWQGEITVQTQRGRAGELLDYLVKLVERVHSRMGLRPSAMERSTSSNTTREAENMRFAQEKSALPEWYVSYAWGDSTPEGKAREQVVDRLCAAAKARGRKILRDKDVLGPGDSIYAFMRRMGDADRVFVILSDKYLRSPHCMFELSEIWRTSRQEGKTFLDRVRVYTLLKTEIWTTAERVKWAVHWQEQHNALEDTARKHGIGILGEAGSAELRLMQRFALQVTDILSVLTGIVQPRDFGELEQYGFREDDEEKSDGRVA